MSNCCEKLHKCVSILTKKKKCIRMYQHLHIYMVKCSEHCHKTNKKGSTWELLWHVSIFSSVLQQFAHWCISKQCIIHCMSAPLTCSSVAQLEVFIIKFVTINRFTTGSIVICKVTSLTHLIKSQGQTKNYRKKKKSEIFLSVRLGVQWKDFLANLVKLWQNLLYSRTVPMESIDANFFAQSSIM